MINANDPGPILSKRKAISALVPYAILQEQNEQQGMADVISIAAATSKSGRFIWHCIGSYTAILFDEPNPPSLNQIIALASPHVRWESLADESVVTRWIAAASGVPYTEQLSRSVVEVLLQVAAIDSHIPVGVWAHLNQRPTLPPISWERFIGTKDDVVCRVRGLGDIETLKSYFLLVWSEWNFLHFSGKDQMEVSIRKDLCGNGLENHREDLIERLEYVLVQLDLGLGYFHQHNPLVDEDHILLAKRQYGELLKVLLEVHGEAARSPSCTSRTSILSD